MLGWSRDRLFRDPFSKMGNLKIEKCSSKNNNTFQYDTGYVSCYFVNFSSRNQ